MERNFLLCWCFPSFDRFARFRVLFQFVHFLYMLPTEVRKSDLECAPDCFFESQNKVPYPHS